MLPWALHPSRRPSPLPLTPLPPPTRAWPPQRWRPAARAHVMGGEWAGTRAPQQRRQRRALPPGRFAWSSPPPPPPLPPPWPPPPQLPPDCQTWTSNELFPMRNIMNQSRKIYHSCFSELLCSPRPRQPTPLQTLNHSSTKVENTKCHLISTSSEFN